MTEQTHKKPLVIPRPEHNISRANISPNALKVLYRLREAGYQAHLVGGGVRDLLLGREPKDFDVATDAHPDEVRQVFRNCRLIGRRFRLAHVHFGQEIIEVATFRAMNVDELDEGEREIENGMILRDNVYGDIEGDAARRDFTVNALYYNIEDFSLIDYAGGLEDLRNGVLRLLGEPEVRYREDPVRMLRAVRFAAKLGFVIAPECERPLFELGYLLEGVPPARLFDEVLKLFMGGTGLSAFEKLRHYNLFGELFGDTEDALAHEDHEFPITFVNRGLENTDRRVVEGKPVTPTFLFAVLLWEPVRLLAEEHLERGEPAPVAIHLAGNEVVERQIRQVAIPKRYSLPMREMWELQPRFEQRNGKRPHRLVTHPRFRAAYDFLMLRADSGEVDEELGAWWTRFVEGDPKERDRLVAELDTEREGGGEKRKRRRRKRRPSGGGNGG